MKIFINTIVLVASLCIASLAQAGDRYIAVGQMADPPQGWIEFCKRYYPVCSVWQLPARDVVLDSKSWDKLDEVNRRVNDTTKPLSDLIHWGVADQWDYPNDGYGDCEDYALQKQWELLQAGWPRQALLITVVRLQSGEGHAVLTVRTDKGEYILDQRRPDILLWSDTEYRFIKRQSQEDPNRWMSLGDVRLLTSSLR